MIKGDPERRSTDLFEKMQQRRSVRKFITEAVPVEVIKNVVSVAFFL
ncbi:MAG: hypothetical protein ACOC10_06730 [Bacteroidota bacterium]